MALEVVIAELTNAVGDAGHVVKTLVNGEVDKYFGPPEQEPLLNENMVIV